MKNDRRNTFIIQKIADYESFQVEEGVEFVKQNTDDLRSNNSIDEEFITGKNGMLLLKIFEFTKDHKVKLCKKILLNDKVEY